MTQSPDPHSGDGSQAQFFMNRGLYLLEIKRYTDARQQFVLALGEEPDNPLLHGYLGVTLCHLGEMDEAIFHAREAMRLGADTPSAMHNAAWILNKSGQLAEAEPVAREVVRLVPQDVDAYSLLGSILHRLRRKAEALEAANQAVQLDPGNAYAHRLLGIVLRDLGRHPEAEAALQESMRHDPEDPWTHQLLAFAHADQGDHQEADEHFRESLRIDPNIDVTRRGWLMAKIWATPIGRLHTFFKRYFGILAVFIVLCAGIVGGFYASRVNTPIAIGLLPMLVLTLLVIFRQVLVEPLGICWLSLARTTRAYFTKWEVISSWCLAALVGTSWGLTVASLVYTSIPLLLLAILLSIVFLPISSACHAQFAGKRWNGLLFLNVLLPIGVLYVVWACRPDMLGGHMSLVIALFGYFAILTWARATLDSD